MNKKIFSEKRLTYVDGGASESSAENAPQEAASPLILPDTMATTQMSATPEMNIQNAPAQQPAPEAMPTMPQMPQGPENMKPVTPEDVKKAGDEAITKSQRWYNGNNAKIDILANIQVDTFTPTT